MPTENPFVGPRPLDRTDGLYGRQQEVRELQWFFTSERIVWLYSPSGAGKTSMVQAGLVPRLEADKFVVLPTIRVNGPADLGGNRYEASVLESLQADATSLHEYLAATASGYSRALIFDQFEEVLTLDSTDVPAKEAFFRSLGRVLEMRDIWALFVIREDYLPALDPYARFLPTLMNHRFRLDLLSVANAREAMEQICRLGGRTLAVEASESLGRELSRVRVASTGEWKQGLSVEPVMLQVVCHGMWEGLPTALDTIEKCHTPSGAALDQSLARYYSNCVRHPEVPAAQERQIRDWIGGKLIVGGIRNQVLDTQGDVAGLNLSLVRTLVKTHLLRSDSRGDRDWYELAHDRLVDPVLADNLRWKNENLHWLERRADLWLVQQRTKAVLLSDAELAAAGSQTLPDLSATAQDFLRQSRDEAGVRGQILFRTRLAWILAGVMTLATAIAVIFYGRASVREQVNLARSEGRGSQEQWPSAIQHGLVALEGASFLGQDMQRAAIEALNEVLQTRPPLHQVVGAVNQIALHAGTSQLVVVTANHATLFPIYSPQYTFRWKPADGCTLSGAEFTPDGRQVVFRLSSGGQTILALADATVDCLAGETPLSMAVSPNGGQRAIGMEDGTVRVTDASGKVNSLALGSKPITSLAWGAGGLVAASRSTGKVWLWQQGQVRSVDHTDIPDVGVASVAMSPDGSRFASIGIGEDHRALVWQTANPTQPLQLRPVPANESVLTGVLFLDNSNLLVADEGGKIRLYPLDPAALVIAAKR